MILVHGQSLNSQRGNKYDDKLIINNVSAGYHNIKIYLKNAGRGGGYRTEVIYDRDVDVKPAYYWMLPLTGLARALIDESQITRNKYNEYHDNISSQWYPSNQQNQGYHKIPPQSAVSCKWWKWLR